MGKKMDKINHPKHYNTGKIEVIEFLEDKKLDFHLANAVKYISRAGHKDPDTFVEDLEKAIWYLRRRVELHKSFHEGREPVRPNDMALKDIEDILIKRCKEKDAERNLFGEYLDKMERGEIKSDTIKIKRIGDKLIKEFGVNEVTKILSQLVGEASMCWDPPPGEATFDHPRAVDLIQKADRGIQLIYTGV